MGHEGHAHSLRTSPSWTEWSTETATTTPRSGLKLICPGPAPLVAASNQTSAAYPSIRAASRAGTIRVSPMPFQAEQMASVARDQVVGLRGLGHREQEVIGWVGADGHGGQRTGQFRKSADLIHHGACCRRPDVLPHPGISGHAPEFFELVFAGD